MSSNYHLLCLSKWYIWNMSSRRLRQTAPNAKRKHTKREKEKLGRQRAAIYSFTKKPFCKIYKVEMMGAHFALILVCVKSNKMKTFIWKHKQEWMICVTYIWMTQGVSLASASDKGFDIRPIRTHLNNMEENGIHTYSCQVANKARNQAIK